MELLMPGQRQEIMLRRVLVFSNVLEVAMTSPVTGCHKRCLYRPGKRVRVFALNIRAPLAA